MGDPVGEVLCIKPCTVMEEVCVCASVSVYGRWCVCDKGSSITSEGQ